MDEQGPQIVRYGGRGEGSLIRMPDSPNWYSRIYARGKEHVKSTGTPDLKLARRKHKALLDELAADRMGLRKFIPPVAQRIRLGELFDDLEKDRQLRGVKSARQMKVHLNHIRAHFADWRASTLTSSDVDVYAEQRLSAGAAPGTINRELEQLAGALRLAQERGKILMVPRIRHLPEHNVREGFYTRAEAEALIAALPDYLKDVARWAYLTGWRIGELRSLTWADVDHEHHEVRLSWRKSKNGEARTMSLVGELADIVDRRWRERVVGCPYVFHRRGKPVGDFRHAWATACEAAGLISGRTLPGGRTFHDFRRTAARNLRRSGVPETVCQAVTGHKTASIFRRYAIVDSVDLREALVKVQAHVETLPTERTVIPLRQQNS
jgi:integrase